MQKSLFEKVAFLFIFVLMPSLCVVGIDAQSSSSLDSTFGGAGIVSRNIGEGVRPDSYLSSLVEQPDGKIVAVGGAASVFAIARFDEHGVLDRPFGENGKLKTDFSTENDFAEDVVVQDDGKIVVVGSGSNITEPTASYISMARYNLDGSLDASFGINGMVQTNFGTGALFGSVVVLQPDNKILVAGTSAGSGSFMVARFNSNGSADLSFGVQGVVLYRNGNNTRNVVNDIALQHDGKVVIVGYTKAFLSSTIQYFHVSRLNSNGSLDNSFGTNGMVNTTFNGNTSNLFNSVKLQGDGKIVVAGSTNNGLPNTDFALVRLNVNGSFDTSFGSGGRVVTTIETSPEGYQSNDRAYSLAISSDGKMFVAGYSYLLSRDCLTIVRYNTDGSLDLTLDGDGKLRTDQVVLSNPLNATIVLTDNDHFVVGGESDSTTPFTVSKFNWDGTYDQSFGGTSYGNGVTPPGLVKTYFGDSQDVSQSTVVLADGKVVVAGNSDGFLSLAKFMPDGSPDLTFLDGGSGKIFLPFNSTSARVQILVQKDNKILACTTARRSSQKTQDFVIVRLNSDGTLDNSFGSLGWISIGFEPESEDEARGIALRSDGKIVVVGKTNATPNGRVGVGVARLNADGSFDNSFGVAGKIVHLSEDSDGDFATSVSLREDGKILVGGIYFYYQVGIMRLTETGDLDLSFNGTGYIQLYVPGFSTSAPSDFIGLPNGDMYFLGSICCPGSMFLLKFKPNGDLDQSFGKDGMLIVPYAVSLNILSKVGVQSNGKIVVTGKAYVNNKSNFYILRFNENGTPDSAFGDEGKLIVDTVPNGDDEATNIAIQANGKILVSGYSGNKYGIDFVIIRLIGDPVATLNSAPFDFDGDGKTDVSVFRPGNGEWWWQRSSDSAVRAAQFGSGADVITPGDFSGDGKTDVAIFRPSSGEWFVLRSEDSEYYAFPFGTNGDRPAPADYDGDGKTDAAVFRPSSGVWYVLRSSDSQVSVTPFGTSGDIPAVADYDGDGKADVAIFRPNGGSGGGEWWYLRSSDGQNRAFAFGASTDKIVPGDYTGDGKADIAFWRPSNGFWYILRSEDSLYYAFPFGLGTDIPAPGDYDGDGRFDAAVFRPSAGDWYISGSTSGTMFQHLGVNGDVPVPSAFVH